MKYRLTFIGRGYFPIGPTLAETGDVFGLYRRHRCLVEPAYVMVYPKVLPIETYDFASRRPIGEVRLANRLYEDPTRTAGVRPYQLGDPLQRLHWKATARTGILHSRVYEPTSLIGATIIIDFHKSSYPHRADIDRSELAITTASSLAYLISTHNQQLGLVSNGRDAADRIRDEALLRRDKSQSSHQNYESRFDARHQYELQADTDRLRPIVIETRRSVDQFQMIREALARLELTDGLTASQLMIEVAPRLPRDATVICLLGAVSVETAVALGNLRKQGFAVSIILIGLVDDEVRAIAAGRLIAEGLQDVRSVNNESEVTTVGDRAAGGPPPEYQFAVELV
jgi:uncharacterized protein (DUF58 family)